MALFFNRWDFFLYLIIMTSLFGLSMVWGIDSGQGNYNFNEEYSIFKLILVDCYHEVGHTITNVFFPLNFLLMGWVSIILSICFTAPLLGFPLGYFVGSVFDGVWVYDVLDLLSNLPLMLLGVYTYFVIKKVVNLTKNYLQELRS